MIRTPNDCHLRWPVEEFCGLVKRIENVTTGDVYAHCDLFTRVGILFSDTVQ